jgi:PST family polysaccharide transporter
MPVPHHQIRRAYVWTLTGNVIRQALSFALSMLLARFLQPNDYGLVGMVGVFLVFLTAVQDLGMGQAVIYFEEAETAWPTSCTVSAAAGLILAAAMFASAPLIAKFYGLPALAPIVRWLSLILLLGGLKSPSQSLITKRLLFHKITAIETVCGLGSAIFAVYLAWRGFGAWSLVVNQLLSATLNTFVVLAVIPPAFTLQPDFPLVRRFLRWGLPLTGSSLCWSFYDNSDELVVGKFASSQQLGYYSLAFRMATLVNEKIGAIISRVSFPVFAAMQTDRESMIRHWLSVTRRSALICFPLLTILAVDASDIIQVVLGAKWLPVVEPLRLLCTVGALRVLTPIIVTLLPAVGNTRLPFQYTLLNTLIMPVSFFIGCRMSGMIGVGLAWVIVFPFLCFWLINSALRLTGTPWSIYLRNLLVPIGAALLVALGTIPYLVLLPNGLFRLLISGLTAAVILLLGFTLYRNAIVRERHGRLATPDRHA